MTNVVDLLNEDELMQLALHAAQHNDPGQAIQHLKRLLVSHPDNAQAHYLLGAFHAEIGLYRQAIEDMTQALTLAPDMAIARFQLGLLHLTSGDAGQAEQVWAPLDTLGESEPLTLFKRGLLLLARNEFDECAELLKSGISLNPHNQELNQDMLKVLAEIGGASPNPEKANESGANPSNGGQRRLLSAYESEPGEDS